MSHTAKHIPTDPRSADLWRTPATAEPFTARTIRRIAPRFSAILQAGRLHNSIALSGVAVLGLFAADAGTATLLYFLAWVASYFGVYLLNDYYDAVADAVNKPWKPVPSGRVGRSTLRYLGSASLVSGMVATVVIGVEVLGLSLPMTLTGVLACGVLGVEYSRIIKPRSPLWANPTISIVLGISAVLPLSSPDASLTYLATLPIYTIGLLAREHLKDLDDAIADDVARRHTFALKYGDYATLGLSVFLARITIAWCIVASFLEPSAGTRCLIFVPFALASIAAAGRRNVAAAQSWLKPALLLTLLVDLLYWSV